jgi:hypothetical protein
MRSRAVEQTLGSPPLDDSQSDSVEADPASLIRVIQRLPPHLRAELRKVLGE